MPLAEAPDVEVLLTLFQRRENSNQPLGSGVPTEKRHDWINVHLPERTDATNIHEFTNRAVSEEVRPKIFGVRRGEILVRIDEACDSAFVEQPER